MSRRTPPPAPVAAVALLAALCVPERAGAHDWYPVACCDQRDCRPAEPGEMRQTPEGWLHVPTGTLVPHDRYRDSPDGRIHVCTYPDGSLRGMRFRSGACLWIPDGGSV